MLHKRLYTDEQGNKLPYRWLTPEPEAPQVRYPLVVFLHGAGERGEDNEKQLIHGVANFYTPANRKKYPCFLVAPQCPENLRWADWTQHGPLQDHPTEATRLVLELVDVLRQSQNIDSKRVYLTGLSMGGFATWDMLCWRPDWFAAAVPVCGGGDENQAGRIASIPIWAFHGARDDKVPALLSRSMTDALKRAGGDPKYTEYPEVGHDSWVRAYQDVEMMKWLFAQKQR